MHFNYLRPIFYISSILDFPKGSPFGGDCSGWWLHAGQHLLCTEMAGNIFCPQDPLSYCLHGVVRNPEVKKVSFAVMAKAEAAL